MDPQDVDKTTLATFLFKLMPSGLCNASATFQRLMNVAVAELDPEVCLVYIDDIIVHTVDFDSHLGETFNETGSSRLETKGVQGSAVSKRGVFSGASGECRRSLCRSNEGGCGFRLVRAMLPAGCAFLLELMFLLP